MKPFVAGFIAVAMLWMYPAAAQESSSLSLQQSLQYAVNHSAQVKKAQLEIVKGQHQIKEILGSGLPQLSLSGNLQYNALLPTSFIPNFFQGKPEELIPVQFGTTFNTQTGIQLQQLLYNKTFDLGLTAAKTLNEFNELLVTKSKEDILLDVARLYYQVQLTAKQGAIIRANLDQVNALLRLTQLQVDNGLGKKVDVDQIKVNKINLENQLQNLQLQHEQQLFLLKYAMQMPLDAPLTLTDTLTEGNYRAPDIAAFLPSFNKRIGLSILDKQQELNQLDVERYRSGYYPSAYLIGNYAWQGQADQFSDYGKGNSWADFAILGVQFSMPLFDGFQRKRKIEQIKVSMLQAEEDRRFTLLSMQLQHKNALQSLQVNINNLQALDENRRLSEEVYRVAQNRFKEGIAPIVEVLNAETAMRTAQTNYLSALFQVKIAEVELWHANGHLLEMVP